MWLNTLTSLPSKAPIIESRTIVRSKTRKSNSFSIQIVLRFLMLSVFFLFFTKKQRTNYNYPGFGNLLFSRKNKIKPCIYFLWATCFWIASLQKPKYSRYYYAYNAYNTSTRTIRLQSSVLFFFFCIFHKTK